MTKHHAVAEILWQKPEEILQRLNSGQSIYALNIRFEGVEGLWSVVLILEGLEREEVKAHHPQVVKIGFLFLDQIKGFLANEMRFVLSEGPSAVIGSGRILEIEKMQ